MRAELAGRPLLAAAFGLSIGISAVAHPLNLLFLVLLVWLCRKRLPTCLWAAGLALVGVLIAPSQPQPITGPTRMLAITGKIVTPPTLNLRGETCLVDSGEHLFAVSFRGHSDLAMGETIRAYGVLLPPGPDFEQVLQSEGASGFMLCRRLDCQVLAPGPLPFEVASLARTSFLQSLKPALIGAPSAVVGAVCFGTSGTLGGGEANALSRTGVSHVLSASGFQVYLLAFLLQLGLSRLPIRRGAQLVVISVFLAAYVCATGLHPSTVRSGIVAIVALCAYLFRREPDILSATGLAAIVTLLWQPWTLYTAGFQLSYAAVLALTVFWRPIDAGQFKKWWQLLLSRVWIVLRTSIVATLAVWPLTAYHFHQVSLVAPAANVLVAPVVPVIICAALLSWPLSFVFPPVQIGLLQIVCGPLAGYLLLVTGWLGRQPWSAISWPSFNPYWIVLYYGGFLLLWERRARVTGSG